MRVVLLAFLAACSVSPSTQRKMAIVDARELRGASGAITLARAIHTAFTAKDYGANIALHQSDSLAALTRLGYYDLEDDIDRPLVLAWRGVLYSDLGRSAEARADWELSFGIAPSFIAGSRLIELYAGTRERDALVTTCQRTYGNTTGEQQLGVADACKAAIGEIAGDQHALAWLSVEEQRRYHAAVARRVAAADAKRVANERAARVAAYVQRCGATCHATAVSCQDGCGPGECRDRCATTYDTCVDACEAQARAWLTPPAAAEQRTAPSARAGSRA